MTGEEVIEAVHNFGLNTDRADDIQIHNGWQDLIADYMTEALQDTERMLDYIDEASVKNEIKLSGYYHRLESGELAFVSIDQHRSIKTKHYLQLVLISFKESYIFHKQYSFSFTMLPAIKANKPITHNRKIQ